MIDKDKIFLYPSLKHYYKHYSQYEDVENVSFTEFVLFNLFDERNPYYSNVSEIKQVIYTLVELLLLNERSKKE